MSADRRRIALKMYNLIVVGCFIGICSAKSYISTFNMESHCDEELSFIWKDLYQTRVKYTNRPFASSTICTYTVESWYSQDRLMFYFENLNLDCSEGSLKIKDGEYDSSITGLEYDICDTKPSGTYTSYNRQVKLTFTPWNPISSNSYNEKEYFNIIFTSFHIGSCSSWEYDCGNGRCIDDDLNCNGYNPCGDKSDCRMSGGVIAGIVIGCICVVGGIIFVAVLVYMCKRKRPVRNPWPATSAATGQPQISSVAYPPAPYPQAAVQYQYQYPPGQAPQPYVQYQQPGFGQYPPPVTAFGTPNAPMPLPNQSAMPPPTYNDAVDMPKPSGEGEPAVTPM